ncbi:hypothetical protein [Methylomonas sp. AM2-LC]|uniref:hypothetical protein n=1 Tax=Methylomonas sp. AM2-LC TaxID=3153301 RepID=UPI0032665341
MSSALLSVEENDNRFWLIGPTFEFRKIIKRLGGKFDAAKKMWFSETPDIASQIVIAVDRHVEIQPAVSITENIIKGKAIYKGHEYFILQDVLKGDKRIIKLVYKDGSKVFHPKSADDVEIKAKYGNHPRSIYSLNQFETGIASIRRELEAH